MKTEENKWWHSESSNYEWLEYGVRQNNNQYGVGFDKETGVYYERTDDLIIDKATPATTEQIKRILGGFAKQEGFVVNVVVVDVHSNDEVTINNDWSRYLDYWTDAGLLFIGGAYVFTLDGFKWAEIVEAKPEPKQPKFKVGDKVYCDGEAGEVLAIQSDKMYLVKFHNTLSLHEDHLNHLTPKREIKLALKAGEPITAEMYVKYNDSLNK